MTKLLLWLLLSLTVANALCTRGPVPSIVSLNQSCVRFIGETTVDHCAPKGDTGLTGATGATGSTGATGETGATGPAPSVLQLDDRCATITGVGNAVVCAPALPAITPVNSSCLTFGSTTICGPAGLPGVIPQTLLVDGTAYALTRAGVQAAIDAVTLLPNGGVVLVTGDITSDGVVSIQIKSKVMLDFGGHTVKAPADATSIEVITIASATASAKSLVADSLRGSDTVNVSTEDAATFSVGDMVMITNGHSPCGSGAPFLDNMANEIVGIDLTTGVLSLRSPLGGNHLVSNLAAVVRHVPIVDAGLRNVIMDANGNTGATTRLVHILGCRRCKFSNIKLIGTHTPNAALLTGSCCGLMFRTGLDSTFSEIGSESYSGGTACRDISFTEQTAALISDVRSYNTGGFAPNVQRLHNSVFRGLISQHAQARGFRIDISSDNDFYGLNSANHKTTAGTGLFIAFGSHHNKIHGLTINNVGAGGLTIGEVYDCYNIVYGLQVARCKSYSVLLGTGTLGNVIYGNIGDALDTLRVQDGGTGNVICSTNTDSGNMACTVPTGIPTAGTFPTRNMLSMSRIDDTHVSINMRGSDGVVRTATLTLSSTGVRNGVAIVDGSDFALTRAGVQAAINAVYSAGGGVVKLAGDVTTDGTAIILQIGVELDCQHHSLKMIPAATTYTMIGAGSGGVAGSYPILENATMGSSIINVGSANAANFEPGDMVLLSGCHIEFIANINAGHMHHIVEVNYGIGELVLRNPLAYSCTTHRAITATRVRQPLRPTTIRNCVLDVNGNTGVGSNLVLLLNQHRLVMDNIKITGNLINSGSGAVGVSGCIDCTFTNLLSEQLTLAAGARDWSWTACEGCVIDNLRTTANNGFGPNIAQSHDCTVSNLFSMHHAIRGFRVDVSSRIMLSNIFSSGHNTSSGYGFFFSFGSHRNIVTGIATIGNTGIGLAYGQTGDDHNQVHGLLAYANTGTDIGITSAATNNYIIGNYEWADSGINADATLQNHLIRVGGVRGLIASTPQGLPFPQTTDLRMYELAVTRANKTHIIESYRGDDGNVRVYVKEFI